MGDAVLARNGTDQRCDDRRHDEPPADDGEADDGACIGHADTRTGIPAGADIVESDGGKTGAGGLDRRCGREDLRGEAGTGHDDERVPTDRTGLPGGDGAGGEREHRGTSEGKGYGEHDAEGHGSADEGGRGELGIYIHIADGF